MNTFRSFFILEFKRFIAWRNAIILISLLALAMYLVHTGVLQYNDILESKKEFREIERLKVKQFNTYRQYGGYGFRLLSIPSPLSILFYNSSLTSDLTCHIDVGEKLNIYNSFKGKDIFAEKPGKLLDFSGVILLFGSLLALFYGYDSYRRKKYLKFISSIHGHKQVFWFICLSRIILLWSFFILVTICAVILLIIHNINLSASDYKHLSVFLLVTLVIQVFFFSIGTITGIIKSKFSRFFIILFWVASVFFVPATINKIVEARSDDMTPNYQLELRKLNTLMDFEKDAEEKLKKPGLQSEKEETEQQSKRKLAENYWRNGFKEIQTSEAELENQMISNITYLQNFSAAFPSTFYLAITNEISSRGHENIIQFYKYAKKIKEQFLRFYIDERYSSKPEEGELKSFIEEKEKKEGKKEANIFYADSSLPGILWWGLLVTLFWIAGLLILSYFLYRKYVFISPKKEIPGLSDLEIELNKGESNVVLSSGEAISDHLYNVLSGEYKGSSGKVLIDGVNIVTDKRKSGFLYICHPEKIPWDIKAKDFILFIGRTLKLSKEQLNQLKNKVKLKEVGKKNFNELEEHEKGRILSEAAFLMESRIFMIDNFAKGMPTDFMKEFVDQLEKLKQEGASILYLTNDVFLAQRIGDYISVLKKDAALLAINI